MVKAEAHCGMFWLHEQNVRCKQDILIPVDMESTWLPTFIKQFAPHSHLFYLAAWTARVLVFPLSLSAGISILYSAKTTIYFCCLRTFDIMTTLWEFFIFVKFDLGSLHHSILHDHFFHILYVWNWHWLRSGIVLKWIYVVLLRSRLKLISWNE